MRLILASQSEWRKNLMELLEVPFEVQESGVDETATHIDDPDELVATLATLKAEAIAKKIQEERVFGSDILEGTLVIGADTVIFLEGEIIGKPVNREDAKAIIQKLAGKTHEVWTGVCVIDTDTNERVIEVEKTNVTFRPIGDKELQKYLDTKEWVGKAGGYQIQGAIAPFVKDVDGSYTNVIGLPLITLRDMLERYGAFIEIELEEILAAQFGNPR